MGREYTLVSGVGLKINVEKTKLNLMEHKADIEIYAESFGDPYWYVTEDDYMNLDLIEYLDDLLFETDFEAFECSTKFFNTSFIAVFLRYPDSILTKDIPQFLKKMKKLLEENNIVIYDIKDYENIAIKDVFFADFDIY